MHSGISAKGDLLERPKTDGNKGNALDLTDRTDHGGVDTPLLAEFGRPPRPMNPLFGLPLVLERCAVHQATHSPIQARGQLLTLPFA
jgi:hypothetical protein